MAAKRTSKTTVPAARPGRFRLVPEAPGEKMPAEVRALLVAARDRMDQLDRELAELQRQPTTDRQTKLLLLRADILVRQMTTEVAESAAREWDPATRERFRAVAATIEHRLRQERATTSGAAGGFKGGRPSAKPMNVEIRKRFDELLRGATPRDARAALVNELSRQTGAHPATVRGWLRTAGIPSER